MNPKFKKFLDVAGKAFLPEEPKGTDWAPGIGGLIYGIVIAPFPGPKKLLIPAYLAIGLAAMPIVGAYYLGKFGHKKLMKNYMDLKEIKIFFPPIYFGEEYQKFNKEMSKIPFKENVKTYNYLICTISDFSNVNNSSAKKFIKNIVENGKFTKENFSDFMKDTVITLSLEGNFGLMDYLLKNKEIKEVIKGREFSYNLDKKELIDYIINYQYQIKNSPLPYLKALSEEDLKFNADSEPKRKPKM